MLLEKDKSLYICNEYRSKAMPENTRSLVVVSWIVSELITFIEIITMNALAARRQEIIIVS